MGRFALLVSLVSLLHGGVCLRAAAQGFNARYDTITSGWWQVGFSIEENATGELLVVSGTPRLDSLYASSTVQVIRLAPDGTLLGVERNHVPDAAAYSGASNTSDVLPDGRIALGGSTYALDLIARVAIYWFDALGDDLGYVEYNFPGNWIGRQLKCTPDGGYVVIGDTDVNGSTDAFLIKLDSVANVQWWQTYGGPQWTDYLFSVDLAPTGGYYLGGHRVSVVMSTTLG